MPTGSQEAKGVIFAASGSGMFDTAAVDHKACIHDSLAQPALTIASAGAARMHIAHIASPAQRIGVATWAGFPRCGTTHISKHATLLGQGVANVAEAAKATSLPRVVLISSAYVSPHRLAPLAPPLLAAHAVFAVAWSTHLHHLVRFFPSILHPPPAMPNSAVARALEKQCRPRPRETP